MTASVTASIDLPFSTLWKNYPNDDPCINPKTGKKAYDDQCAIRLGMALEKSGVSFASFRGPRCEFGLHGNGMVLRAEELAMWLRKMPFKGCPAVQVLAGKGFQQQLKGRTGIVFLKTTGIGKEKNFLRATISTYGTMID